VAAGICLVALAVIAGILFAAGAHDNVQVAELRQHGVPVEVTVTKCLGLLGGSGSNAAGYTCRGTFVVDGRRFYAALPDTSLYASGTKLREITVADDPGLLSTPAAVERQRPSGKVFILPSGLLAVVLLSSAALLVKGRRRYPLAGTSSASGSGEGQPALLPGFRRDEPLGATARGV
jgi:hypothetical protein